MMHQFGKVIVIAVVSCLILLPNVYADPDSRVKQMDRETDNTSEHIVGGTAVPEGERTFQVALVREDGTLHCGGAIIGDSWVMTAAHCVEGGEPLQVLSGTRRLDQGGTLHSMAESHMHPYYDGYAADGYDIALIKVIGTFPDNLERLKIATPEIMSTHGTPGTKAVVSGWGRTSGTGNISNQLLQTVQHITSDSQCQQLTSSDIYPETIICAMDQVNSSCFGDSGGPLTISRNGELYGAGTVSFGKSSCSGYSAYAETANLRRWIARYVDIDEAIDVQPGTYRISNVMSALCMDVKGASVDNAAPVLQWNCHSNDNQKWQIEAVGEYYRLVAVHSGQVLDVPRSSIEEYTGMIQWPWHGGDNQLWKIIPVDDGSYEIINVNSNLCLGIMWGALKPGRIAEQMTCEGVDNDDQRWILELME